MRQLRLFFAALAYFTRIPCTRWAGGSAVDLNHAARYFPLVGVVVGGSAALVYWLALHVWPHPVAVLASMAATLWLTGAFHEDGLADAADGLGGGWSREQVLAIMKDSRIGSYGVLALVMALLLKYAALAEMTPLLLMAVLVAGHALSRLMAVLVITRQDYLREEGKAKPLATRLGRGELLAAALFGLAPLALLPAGALLWTLPAVALAWLWFSRKLRHRLGGYTGDCLGAMQQLTEIAFYLGAVAWSST